MRILSRKILVLALALSVLVEAASFVGMALVGSDTTFSRILFGFHRPGIEAAGLLIPELHEDDPNVSTFELAVVWVVVVTMAMVQWFAIFLPGITICRRFQREDMRTFSPNIYLTVSDTNLK